MVYQPHTLIAFGGTLLAGPAGDQDEIWECTVRAVQADRQDHTINDPAAYMAGIAQPLADWYANGGNFISNSTTLDFLKVNNIGANGKYEDTSNTNRHDYTPHVQGSTAPIHPDIISCCYSWRTDKKRGPGSKGRIYPPNFTLGSAGSMTLVPTVRANHLGAAQRLVHLLEIGDGDVNEARLVVASKVNATNTPITEIAIGSILDVQRRRKNAEIEVYTTGPRI